MRKLHTMASFEAKVSEWRVVADDMSAHGENRIASAIAHGLKRWQQRYGVRDHHEVTLRFRDGSIAKLDAYIARQKP